MQNLCPSPDSNARKTRAFTLIELLVVIAIIAILAAILFPVFAQAREKARQTSCLSNLKQWGIAFNAYASDYDETLPSQQYGGEVTGNDVNWVSVLQPYVENQQITGAANRGAGNRAGSKIAVCPSQILGDRIAPSTTNVEITMSYGFSTWAVGSRDPRFGSGPRKASADPASFRPLAQFTSPASTIMLAEIGIVYSQSTVYPVDNDAMWCSICTEILEEPPTLLHLHRVQQNRAGQHSRELRATPIATWTRSATTWALTTSSLTVMQMA
jgi:prepilin-type N-terminal cleavage/methylation domain-containing protein